MPEILTFTEVYTNIYKGQYIPGYKQEHDVQKLKAKAVSFLYLNYS